MKKILTILLMLMICVTDKAVAQNLDINKNNLKLSWNREKINLYHHEPAVITLYLWIQGYDVQGVRKSKSSTLNNGKFSYLKQAEFDRQPRVVKKDGETWTVYPIDSYAIAMDKAGKYKLQDGRYVIDLAVPVIYDDPFWGKMQTLKTQRIEVPVNPVQITVSDLPPVPHDTEFSGAVGDFKVEVTVPPGDIFLNEEATAIVTITGNGWLNDDTLPEYHDAFLKGTKLKSFSENRQQYLRDGKMISELQMECTFIPTDKNAEISPVWLEVFNPIKGVYETVKSEPVKVKVQSIAAKAPTHDI